MLPASCPPSRALIIGLALALVVGACGSDPTAAERAAARAAILDDQPVETSAPVAPTGSAPPTTVAGTDCSVADCPPDTTAGGDRLDAALASIPDDQLRFQVGATLALAEEAAAQCADLAAWAELLDETAQAIRTLAATASSSGGNWLASDNATTIANEVRDQVVGQAGCTDGDDDATALDAALAAAGQASAANDDLHLALTTKNPATGSEFWYHADQIGHTLEIQRLVETDGSVEILVIGSSTAKRGFDAGLVTSSLGRSTMNAAVAGLFPTTMKPWTDAARALSSEPATVIVGVSSFQDFLECTDSRQVKMTEAVARQDLAFAPVPALAAVPAALRLVGGPSATYDSIVLDEYTPEPGSRGQMPTPDNPNPESITFYTDLYQPQMANAEYCPQNAAAVSELLTDLVADGVEVLVVSLPLSPLMAELHPAGRPAHDEAIDEYERVTTAAGAMWLDLTDLLTAEEFLDLTHATSPGRDKITAATIEALS